MTIRAPFKPHFGSGVTVTPAAASAQGSFPSNSTARTVRLANVGAAVCHFRTYPNAEAATLGTATAADVAVPAGAVVLFERDPAHDKFAHISATGTTLHVMLGDGGA